MMVVAVLHCGVYYRRIQVGMKVVTRSHSAWFSVVYGVSYEICDGDEA